MQCRVLRSFPGPEGKLEPHAIIDTSAWRPRNVAGLIRTRYLEAIPDPPDEDDDDEGLGENEDANGTVSTVRRRPGRPAKEKTP